MDGDLKWIWRFARRDKKPEIQIQFLNIDDFSGGLLPYDGNHVAPMTNRPKTILQKSESVRCSWILPDNTWCKQSTVWRNRGSGDTIRAAQQHQRGFMAQCDAQTSYDNTTKRVAGRSSPSFRRGATKLGAEKSYILQQENGTKMGLTPTRKNSIWFDPPPVIHEKMLSSDRLRVEPQKTQRRLWKITSRTDVMFPRHTTTWHTNRFPD